MAELAGRQYGFDTHSAIRLESKADMKKRGLSSPDNADALHLLAVSLCAQGRSQEGIACLRGVIALKQKIMAGLHGAGGDSYTAEALAAHIGVPEKTEIVFKILEHLAANKNSGVKKRVKTPWFASTYRSA